MFSINFTVDSDIFLEMLSMQIQIGLLILKDAFYKK